jgi:hypothetical protein
LLLIQLVQDTVVSFYLDLSTDHILSLAAAVEKSYSFAHNFNSDIELRFSLWRAGFMNQVPNLLKQETSGLTAYLRIIFWLYLDPTKNSAVAAEPRLMALCNRVLLGFVRACNEARAKPEERREVSALIPIVTFIVNGMMQMSNEQFDQHLPSMYNLLLSLLESSDDLLVRSAVANLFRARIGTMLELPSEDGSSFSPYVPQPQVPGRRRERVFIVDGVLDDDTLSAEVQSALSRVSGVRSAFVDSADGTARVYASAPDELLIAAMSGCAKVRSVALANGLLDSDRGVGLS